MFSSKSAYLLFAQLNKISTGDDHYISTHPLTSIASVQPAEPPVGEDAAAVNAWFKALFDISSEGIEDNILRHVLLH